MAESRWFGLSAALLALFLSIFVGLVISGIVTWKLMQPSVLPVVTGWRVTRAVMTPLTDQLVIEGYFTREFDDDQCTIESLRMYGSDGLSRALFDIRPADPTEIDPARVNRPVGSQKFGPIVVDTRRAPSAFLLEGKTVHRCFEFGLFPGMLLVSRLHAYDYDWLNDLKGYAAP